MSVVLHWGRRAERRAALGGLVAHEARYQAVCSDRQRADIRAPARGLGGIAAAREARRARCRSRARPGRARASGAEKSIVLCGLREDLCALRVNVPISGIPIRGGGALPLLEGEPEGEVGLLARLSARLVRGTALGAHAAHLVLDDADEGRVLRRGRSQAGPRRSRPPSTCRPPSRTGTSGCDPRNAIDALFPFLRGSWRRSSFPATGNTAPGRCVAWASATGLLAQGPMSMRPRRSPESSSMEGTAAAAYRSDSSRCPMASSASRSRASFSCARGRGALGVAVGCGSYAGNAFGHGPTSQSAEYSNGSTRGRPLGRGTTPGGSQVSASGGCAAASHLGDELGASWLRSTGLVRCHWKPAASEACRSSARACAVNAAAGSRPPRSRGRCRTPRA